MNAEQKAQLRDIYISLSGDDSSKKTNALNKITDILSSSDTSMKQLIAQHAAIVANLCFCLEGADFADKALSCLETLSSSFPVVIRKHMNRVSLNVDRLLVVLNQPLLASQASTVLTSLIGQGEDQVTLSQDQLERIMTTQLLNKDLVCQAAATVTLDLLESNPAYQGDLQKTRTLLNSRTSAEADSQETPAVTLGPIPYYEGAKFRQVGGRIAGTSLCSAVFEFEDKSHWLGKCNPTILGGDSERVNATLELVASGIYEYYGVEVPETALASLPIILSTDDLTVTQMGFQRGQKATYVMSKLINNFHPLASIPRFNGGEKYTLRVDGENMEAYNLGRSLAVAALIFDVDVFGGSGGNMGCQKNAGDGKAYFFKIDPGEAFNTNSNLSVPPRCIRVATQHRDGVVAFDNLPDSLKREFIETVALIVQTTDDTIKDFFSREGSECLRDKKASLIDLLIQQRDALNEMYKHELAAHANAVVRAPQPRLDRTQPVGMNAQAIARTMAMTMRPERRQATQAIGGAVPDQQAQYRPDNQISYSIKSSDLHYDYSALLGEGSFARVYPGTYFGKQVAIKKLKTDQGGRFQGDAFKEELKKEGQLMMELRHPCIMRAYGVCLEPGNYSLVMHYYPQGNLNDVLRKSKGSMPWPTRQSIAKDIAWGLTYLHANNVVHRDLKSFNILIEGNNVPVITDFGTARVSDKLEMTKTLGAVGSIPWMAPEMIDSEIPRYTKAADVYSLSMVFVEFVLGNGGMPWDEVPNVFRIYEMLKRGQRPQMTGYTPPAFASLIERCWNQNPGERLTAKQAAEELQRMC